jgi:hypothetical protein
VEVEKSVQADQLEAPVDCVGNAVLSEKDGLPRLLDDPLVGSFGGFANRSLS